MKRPRPDTRLDWRDPAMPVLLAALDNDENKVMIEVGPNTAIKCAKARFMQQVLRPDLCPSWREDPTYNLRRKKP